MCKKFSNYVRRAAGKGILGAYADSAGLIRLRIRAVWSGPLLPLTESFDIVEYICVW